MKKATAAQWLRDHAGYEHEYCLMWPFARTRGYGIVYYEGRQSYAHRVMCEMVRGVPPSDKHQAAHTCGRGHEGCVNPQHLVWKTQSENQLDCRLHGTQAKARTGSDRLSDAVAQQIRLLKGVKLQREIAEQFGVSESTVSDIWLGRSHSHLSKIKYWTDEERQAIRDGAERGKSWPQIAKELGRSKAAVSGYAGRHGIRSGYAANQKIQP